MNEIKQKGMFVGLAIGDALGMPLEFKQRGTFEPLDGLVAGGPFNLPLGYWTDDTSMALCLADSFCERKGYDSFDVMGRFRIWKEEGYRSSTGTCFDIGNQVSSAIAKYKNQIGVTLDEVRTEAAGNGCIMRLAPVVIASMSAGNSLVQTMQLASISARETHYSTLAEQATAVFAALLVNAVNGKMKEDVLQLEIPKWYDPRLSTDIQNASAKTESELKPSGFVLDTLEVAIWAFMTSDNFKTGALKAVNLGGDSDTIGAVYGQLAGAFYGLEGIPEEWRSKLYQYEEMCKITEELCTIKEFSVIQTRFDEDSQGRLGVSHGTLQITQSDDEKAVHASRGIIGASDIETAARFVPSEEQEKQFQHMRTPYKVDVRWMFNQAVYDRLALGFESHGMDDRWHVYMEGKTLHFHRSWTGSEIFRFKIDIAFNSSTTADAQADLGYVVTSFEVEQDPEHYLEFDEVVNADILKEVISSTFGIDASDITSK